MARESDKLFQRACRAYARYCDAHGYLYNEPSYALSGAQGRGVSRHFVLRNGPGELHRFTLKDGKLRTIEPKQ